MEVKKLIAGLHPLERKVLPVLGEIKELDAIADKTGLKDVEVMRALQWLSNKKVLDIKEELKEAVGLGSNGKIYAEKGLPEKRFLEALTEKDFIDSEELIKKADLDKQEFGVSMGTLKKNSCVLISKEKDKLLLKKTPASKVFLDKILKEEEFLKKEFPVEIKSLNEEEREAFESLKQRKDMLEVSLRKLKSIKLNLRF